ncbi:hypothetical protein ZEAMMB73_Zm00001d042393 [Zea mays]|uniref:Uncharacterized protein n=1 Tax=Zea mays TaxID=4577 RepID=A0A1D6N3F9_MAIZE|nr:hypothetical protein ZEAMMB73_Zm00001d042393 [Zea mays]
MYMSQQTWLHAPKVMRLFTSQQLCRVRSVALHHLFVFTGLGRVTRTSSSQPTSGSWSRSTITALASQRSRRIPAHSNP